MARVGIVLILVATTANGVRLHRDRAQARTDSALVVEGNKVTECDLIDVDCWIQAAKGAVSKVEDLTKKLAQQGEEVLGLTNKLHALQAAEGAMQSLGACLNTLPGGTSPLDTLADIGSALSSNNLLTFFEDTYATPMLDRVMGDLNRTISSIRGAALAEEDLVKDGKFASAILGLLPEKVSAFAKELVVNTDPTMQCLFEKGGALDQLNADVYEPLITKPLNTTLNAIGELWNLIAGPGSLIGGLLETMAQSIQADLAALWAPVAEFDKTVGDAIDVFCREEFNYLTGVIKSANVPKAFCQKSGTPFEQDLKEGLALIFSSVMTWTSQELSKLLNKWVWLPAIAELVRLVGQALSSIMQLVDGLCGLIPEAGGPICMAITVPVSAVANQLIQFLSSATMKGLVDSAEAWLVAQIPVWSLAAADTLVDLLADATEDIGDELAKLEPPKLKAFGDQVGEIAGATLTLEEALIQPVLNIAEPVFNWMFNTTFPTIASGISTCASDVGTVAKFIEDKLCAPI